MRKRKLMSLLLAACLLLGCTACSRRVEPVSLGAPTAAYYPDNFLARCVWDMCLYEGKLYVGSGDYDRNAGPVPVLCYDFEAADWQEQTFLPDEQIGRFLTLDGKLTVPGFDPDGSPEIGYYYQLEAGEWQVKQGLPDGLHNYDLVAFDGRLFAAIGAVTGESPIAVSEDGTTFQRVPMIKDGAPLDTTDGACIRVHNFFQLKGELYAQLWYENTTESRLYFEMYRYRDGAFHFHAKLADQLGAGNGAGSRTIPHIFAKETFGDKVYLTTGALYVTEDMRQFSMVELPDYARTYDIVPYGKHLYIVAAAPPTGGVYTVRIFRIGRRGEPKELVYFDSALPPTALEVDDHYFYVALGDWWSDETEENGTVVEIKR